MPTKYYLNKIKKNLDYNLIYKVPYVGLCGITQERFNLFDLKVHYFEINFSTKEVYFVSIHFNKSVTYGTIKIFGEFVYCSFEAPCHFHLILHIKNDKEKLNEFLLFCGLFNKEMTDSDDHKCDEMDDLLTLFNKI